MPPLRLSLLSLVLSFALAGPASAQDESVSPHDAGVFPRGFDQVVYKGLVGNVLDAVPMDPADRLGLQRTNAVVSSTLFGRSLALLAGLSNPVLLLGGFVWGVWSAANINPVEAGMTLAANHGGSGSSAAAPERALAPLHGSPAADAAPLNAAPRPVLLVSNSTVNSELSVRSRPRVIKIWLPQRAPARLQ